MLSFTWCWLKFFQQPVKVRRKNCSLFSLGVSYCAFKLPWIVNLVIKNCHYSVYWFCFCTDLWIVISNFINIEIKEDRRQIVVVPINVCRLLIRQYIIKFDYSCHDDLFCFISRNSDNSSCLSYSYQQTWLYNW